jgi:hypothetical protein
MIDNRRLDDLLDEHSRSYPSPEPGPSWLAGLPQGTLLLVPLLMLAHELAELLVPVRPRPAFRAQLHADLVEDARRQFAAPMLTPTAQRMWGEWPRVAWHTPDWIALSWPTEGEHGWLLRAAAVGSALSLLGYVAYRSRRGSKEA